MLLNGKTAMDGLSGNGKVAPSSKKNRPIKLD
jgi:hypothetical protein